MATAGKCGSGQDGLKKQTPQYPTRGAKKKDGGDGAGYLYDLKLPNEKTLRDEKRRGREESGSRCAAVGCWLGFPKTERRSWRSPGANPVQLDIRSRP